MTTKNPLLVAEYAGMPLGEVLDEVVRRADRPGPDRQLAVDHLCEWLRHEWQEERWSVASEAKIKLVRRILDLIHLRLGSPDVPGSYCGLSFDFSDATVRGLDLRDVHITGGIVDFSRSVIANPPLKGARSLGGVSFRGARLSGGEVRFEQTTFLGRGRSSAIDFSESRLEGADVSFESATFTGGLVRFDNCYLSGGTLQFDNARFIDNTFSCTGIKIFDPAIFSFRNACFDTGISDFTGLDVVGGCARFDEAKFYSIIKLDSMKIESGSVSFDRAETNALMMFLRSLELSGGRLSMLGWKLSGGEVVFDGTEIKGGDLILDDSVLSSGTVAMDRMFIYSGSLSLDVDVVGLEATVKLPWATYKYGTLSPKVTDFQMGAQRDFPERSAAYRPGVVRNWGRFALAAKGKPGSAS
jgi:uncharacterized protein YjbI with pentapeptide repeats